MTKLLSLAVWLLATTWANAGSRFYTGNDLIRHCEAPEEKSGDRILCSSYIAGVVDVLMLQTSCDLPSMQLRQFVRMFVSYGNKHPEYLHGSAAHIVGLSLADRGLCGLEPTAKKEDP